MRVTPSMNMASTLRELNASFQRLTKTQSQMSTGKVLTSASDDPNVALKSMNIRNSLAQYDVFDRAVGDARGWLGAADSALTGASDTLIRAKETLVRASNTGSLGDPNARQALAADIRAVRSELLALANTSYNGRSVFGGTVAGAAYSAAGAYQGNTASVVRDVDPYTSVTVNVTGIDAFGDPAAAGGDVFAVLDAIATAISNGDDAALAAGHTALDTASARISNALVTVGSRGKQMELRETRNADERERLSSLLTNTEDIDLADVMVHLKEQENAYQAALQVAGNILPKSLVDYLR